MKSTSLKFSLCLSLGVHAAVAAVVFCVGDKRKATGAISESVITLELVEAGDAEQDVLYARSDDQFSQMEVGKPALEQAMLPEPNEILHEVEPLKPEHRQPAQHRTFVRDGIGQNAIKRGNPVSRDEEQMLAEVEDFAHLAAGDFGNAGKVES